MDDPLEPLQIFIVEDSGIICNRLDDALTAAGAVVIGHGGTANEAIAALALLHPDVIIIDIQLSSGTGFDVLRALQATRCARSEIKIVLTNHTNAEYRTLSFQLGANAFFDKSSESSQALELIHRLAAQRRHSDGGSMLRSPQA